MPSNYRKSPINTIALSLGSLFLCIEKIIRQIMSKEDFLVILE